jgi:hypothetical protein
MVVKNPFLVSAAGKGFCFDWRKASQLIPQMQRDLTPIVLQITEKMRLNIQKTA